MFKFGPYQLDQHTFRLTKKGIDIDIDIEIEPQVFNTLLLLIENRERVVTKGELLEKIWHGRAVSDQVITRIIYELRKILDEKSGQDSHIRTVRGKGYQFIAEVTENQQISHSAVEPSQPATTPDRPPLRKMILVLGLVVLAAVSFVLINQPSQPPNSSNNSSPVSNQKTYPVVAVLPIKVDTGNEELSILVQSLIDYLTNQLAVNLNMKVVHPDSLVSMGDELNDVWAIQKATRSDFIIQGFIEPVAEQRVNLHLTLYKNNVDGELIPYQLGAFQFPYPENVKQLNDLYKQRKVTVRSIIQIIKPGVIVKDNGNTETDDPEAYRLVIAAHHMLRNDDCEDIQRAEQLLLKAVERDDEFAYAYYQLFANYFKRVWLCGDSIEFHQKALAMAEIVQRLAPNSYNYNPIVRGMNAILIESNQVEKAYELSKDANWNDTDAINQKNYALRYAGFLNVANQQLDRILQLDPFYFSEKPINQAPNTLLYQNHFTEYLGLLAEPGNSYHDYYRGLSLMLTDKTLEATKILQGVIERTPTDLFGRLSQALLFILEHDNAGAIKIIDGIVQQRNEKKLTDGEMTYKLVQLYALANAHELALKNLQITVDQGFFPMNYFLNDPALNSIQNIEQFTAIVEQATQRHEAFAERFGLESESLVDLTLNQ
ncbi:Adenylate cyclase [hydrothermal vent metagenome]|uniref:Adenylate cyclase n=1 Tax=hydrothermal vent metagenome TaxID=652676 RepID=A0A3B0W3G7_9ZZZZ